jgi:hypothetical protein
MHNPKVFSAEAQKRSEGRFGAAEHYEVVWN